ncbi:right-handed parallel beta-helix repeat-containing protein [Mucilaginibacter frigoritolerans]|nr:right-handed parallel beta-helix repeat-containing protein [Mucilaginibacter frigoritolerans]
MCIRILPFFISAIVIFILLNAVLESKRIIPRVLQDDPNNLPKAATAGDKVGINSSPVYLKDAHDLTITGKTIVGGLVADITLINCYNIHITRNKLCHSVDVGIRLYKCKNIHVDNNYFNDVSSGLYAEKTNEGGIVVDHNQFLNMQGPFPRGQFVQFNNVNGPGNAISYNRCENILGKSNPEDAISLYKSNGTSQSPIMVKGNWIRGGGPSKTGGGIMLGDNGGSYLTASYNILIDPGQYGIAISGGDHNSIVNNFIYCRSQSFTNVGLYVASYSGGPITNSKVAQNKVKCFNNKNNENNVWLSPGTPMPIGWETNSWGANIGPSLLPAIIITRN